MPHLDDEGRRVFDDRERHRPTRGRAHAHAGARRIRARCRLRRGRLRLLAGRGARRGDALSAVQEPHVPAGLPGQHRHPRLHPRDHRRQLGRRGHGPQGAQRTAGGVRPGLPARGAVREDLRARQEGRADRDRPPRALPRRLRSVVRPRAPVRARDRRAERLSLRGRRQRTRRARVRGRACPARPRRDGLRVAPRARRRARPTASRSSGCPSTSSTPRSRRSPRWASRS